MPTSILAAVAATGGVLAVLLIASGLSRAPPLRPLRSSPSVLDTGDGATRLWVCVTPATYCSSPPRPAGEPCTCLDPWQGWQPGRVRTEHATAPSEPLGWPSRAEEEEPGPPAGWIVAP